MRHYNKIDVRRDKKFRLKQQEKQKQINQQQIIKGTKSSSDNVLFSKSEQVENTKEKSIFSRIKEKVSNILDYGKEIKNAVVGVTLAASLALGGCAGTGKTNVSRQNLHNTNPSATTLKTDGNNGGFVRENGDIVIKDNTGRTIIASVNQTNGTSQDASDTPNINDDNNDVDDDDNSNTLTGGNLELENDDFIMNFNPKTATREDIKELQRLLIERGYNLGMYGPDKDGIDGVSGKKTGLALKQEQGKIKVKREAPNKVVASDLEDEEETSDEYGDDYEYQSPLNGETIITAEKAKTILDSLQIHPSSAGAQLNYDNAKVKFGVGGSKQLGLYAEGGIAIKGMEDRIAALLSARFGEKVKEVKLTGTVRVLDNDTGTLYISLTGGFQVAEQEYQFSIRKVKENVETAGGGVAIQYYPKSGFIDSVKLGITHQETKSPYHDELIEVNQIDANTIERVLHQLEVYGLKKTEINGEVVFLITDRVKFGALVGYSQVRGDSRIDGKYKENSLVFGGRLDIIITPQAKFFINFKQDVTGQRVGGGINYILGCGSSLTLEGFNQNGRHGARGDSGFGVFYTHSFGGDGGSCENGGQERFNRTTAPDIFNVTEDASRSLNLQPLTRQAEKRTTLEVIDISSLNILIQQAEYDIQNNSAFYSSADLQALQDAVTEATNYLNSGKENITKEKTKYYEDLLKSIMAKKLSPQINFGSFSFNSVASGWSGNLEIPVTYVGSQLPVCSVSSATSGVGTPSSQSTGIGTSKCIVPITSASSPGESFNLKVQVNGVSANINATLTVSAANNLPTGQNLTGLGLNASYSKHFEFDLSSYINDADGDTITINITNIQTNNGLVINGSVNGTRLIFDTVSGSGDITSIKYILNDGKGDSPEYTIDGVIGFFHY